MTTRRQAKRTDYAYSHKITPRASKNHYHRLTPEETAFVDDRIRAGLTDKEVCRMFFRRFGRDITPGCPRDRRPKIEEARNVE